jgi:hypothetical protein
LLQHQRDCGSESKDEDERTLELAQKQPERAQARGIFNTVWSDKRKLRCGSIGRKTARLRPEGHR